MFFSEKFLPIYRPSGHPESNQQDAASEKEQAENLLRAEGRVGRVG